jgi:hypothetical protein
MPAILIRAIVAKINNRFAAINQDSAGTTKPVTMKT